MVLILHVVELILVAISLLLQLSLMLLVKVLFTNREIIILTFDQLLHFFNSDRVLQLLRVPLVLVPLVIRLDQLDRLVSFIAATCRTDK